jgi:hypothetical protein
MQVIGSIPNYQSMLHQFSCRHCSICVFDGSRRHCSIFVFGGTLAHLTMPACCSRCTTPDAAIPLMHDGGSLCEVCGRLIHSVWSVGPIFEIPQCFTLMRNVALMNHPRSLHPDGHICPTCLDQHGGDGGHPSSSKDPQLDKSDNLVGPDHP